MKCLLIYCRRFGYTPGIKTLAQADANVAPREFENIQTAFIQVEREDMENATAVERKLIKNLKWICGKNEAKEIVLHSFAHLSASKADPDDTKALLDRIDARMAKTGYTVHQTPFGYFLDLRIDAPGFSLARVFKSI